PDSARTCARKSDRAVSSVCSVHGACRVGPPSSSAVRGLGREQSARNCWRARSSQASSTGLRLPSRVTTLPPRRRSCSGTTTTSQCRLSMRGSRICTALAPCSRASRPASAPWRPQPMAISGGWPLASAEARPGPNACRAPGIRRGASQRQGARGARVGRCGDSRPMAAASASAWRTLPALPSVSSQALAGAFRSMRDSNTFQAEFGKTSVQHSTLPPPVARRRTQTLPEIMSQPLNESVLDQLFTRARTYNAFSGEVSEETLRQLYDLLKLGPTAANTGPARLVFVKSAEAKARLAPALAPGNLDKTMSAPVTVIIGRDLDFHEKLPYLFPHADAKAWFEGPREGRDKPSLLNMSLQAGY